MISHEHAAELYGAYFRNELSRETVREFHTHINGCEECRVRLRVMKAGAGSPGFTRAQKPGEPERYREILGKNRALTYVVLGVLICFLILFRVALR